MKKKTSILLIFVKIIVISCITINSKATDGALLSIIEKNTKETTNNFKESSESNNQTLHGLNSKKKYDSPFSEKHVKEIEKSNDQINNITPIKNKILVSKESQKQAKNIQNTQENFAKISKATTTIFLSGLFDKSFFITAFMAMKYSKWIVLFSTTLSLSLIGILSVFLGVTINQYVSVVCIDSFAVALFLIFGVHMMYEGFYLKEEEETEVQILGRKGANADCDEEKGLFIPTDDQAEINIDKDNNYNNCIYDNQNGDKICDCSAAERKKIRNSKFKEQNISNTNNSIIRLNKGSGRNKRIENNEVVPITANSFNFISQKGNENKDPKTAAANGEHFDKNNDIKINSNSAADSVTGLANSEQAINNKSNNLTFNEASTTIESVFCCEKSRDFYSNMNNQQNNENSTSNLNKTYNNNDNKNNPNQSTIKPYEKKENNKLEENSNKNFNQSENKQIANLAEIHFAKYLCNNSIQVFSKVFFLIFFSEIGDRSQISTIYLTTNFDNISVIIAVVVSSTALTILAVFGGKLLANKISEKKLTIFAGLVFIVFGLIAFYLLLMTENVNEGQASDSSVDTSVSPSTPSKIINEMIIPNITNKMKQKIL